MYISRSLPLITLLILALGLTGCDQAGDPGSLISVAEVQFIPMTVPEAANPAVAIAAGADEAFISQTNEAMEAAMRDLLMVDRLIASESDWKDADAIGEEVVQRWAATPQTYIVTQRISHNLLRRLIHEGGSGHDYFAAVERHTSRLIAMDHPDLPLLLDGIAFVRDVWTDEQSAIAIEQAIIAAEEWLDKNPCDDCLGEGVRAESLLDARDQQIAYVTAAVPVASGMLQQMR